MNYHHRSSTLLLVAKTLPLGVVCLSVMPSASWAVTQPATATAVVMNAVSSDSHALAPQEMPQVTPQSLQPEETSPVVAQRPVVIPEPIETATQLPLLPTESPTAPQLISATTSTAVQLISALPVEGQAAWQQVAGKPVDRSLVATLQSLVSRYPQYIPGHLQLAKGLEAIGQRGEAVTALERAVALYPDQADLARALVTALTASNRSLEAAIVARQFVTNNPHSPWVQEFNLLADNNQKVAQASYQRPSRSNLLNNVVTGGVTYVLTGQAPASSLTGALTSLQGEAAIGSKMAQDMLTRVQVINDTEVANYVNTIGQKLVRMAGRNDLQYQFYVVKDASATATALPGGQIFVNAGAITSTNSEAELAAILARQIAHSTLAHPMRLVNQGNVTSTVAQVVPNLLLGRTGQTNSVLGNVLGTQTNNLSNGIIGNVLGNVLGSRTNSSNKGLLGSVLGNVLGSQTNSANSPLGSILGSRNSANNGVLGNVLGSVLGAGNTNRNNGLLGTVLNGVAGNALAGVASNTLSGWLQPNYSRQMNADADQLAGRLLASAGYNSPTSGDSIRHGQIKAKVDQLMRGGTTSNWWTVLLNR